MSKRITDLTDLAMGEMGILQLNYQPIDVKSMSTKLFQYMNFEAEKKQITLSSEITDSTPMIWGDGKAVYYQVMINLPE